MRALALPLLCAAALAACSDTAGLASPAETPAADEGGITLATYRGLRYGALPQGVIENGGVLLEAVDGSEYGFSHMETPAGMMLWLNRLTHRDDAGRAHWAVLDALALPPLQQGQQFAFYGCERDENADSELVALVEAGEGDYHPRVLRAWRGDRRTGRFTEIAVGGIRCINDSEACH